MINESWENDMLETATPNIDSTVELPRYLAELRDGTAPPRPQQGAARARRLEQMQHDIIACDDFVADLDRYSQHLIACPPACIGPTVPDTINAYIAKRRKQAVDMKRQLHEELIYLRSVS
jgi:hypothetical protein